MKLFSSFDTKKKQKTTNRHIQEFGEYNVLVVSKSYIYRILYVFIPIIFYILLEVIFVYMFFEISWWWIFIYFILFFATVSFFLFVWPIIKKYIAYKMDFMIINPISIIKYDQEWFFERDVRNINVQNLQSIRTKRSSWIRSVFNIWDILFISESSELWTWEWNIEMHFIHDPEATKNKILKIITKYIQKDSNHKNNNIVFFDKKS